jgi:hypothetical protein
LTADGAAAALVRFWAADAGVLAVFLAGDFTSALLLGPENSRSWVLTPEDGGMDSLVNAGVFIPRLDEAPFEALFGNVGRDCNDRAEGAGDTGADGVARLWKNDQNIRRPPRIGPNLGPRCLWANRCQ